MGHESQIIGQLTMRNLNILNTHAKLGIYAYAGLLSVGKGPHILKLNGSGKK
jgi:argininosuccinate synthase